MKISDFSLWVLLVFIPHGLLATASDSEEELTQYDVCSGLKVVTPIPYSPITPKERRSSYRESTILGTPAFQVIDRSGSVPGDLFNIPLELEKRKREESPSEVSTVAFRQKKRRVLEGLLEELRKGTGDEPIHEKDDVFQTVTIPRLFSGVGFQGQYSSQAGSSDSHNLGQP